jgi:penicillin-binding protein 1A
VEYEPPDRRPLVRTPPLTARRRAPPRPWLRFGLPLAAAVVAGAAVGVGFAAAIHVPRVERLSDYTPRLITHLYDRHRQGFAEYARERRVMLQAGEVPELLQNAVVAAEDRNFLRHGGVDAQGVARAALANLRSGRKGEGASTITMQLARELFLTKDKRWSRKINEAFLAVELEKRLSKQQILTLYCNLINVGGGNYGMEAAARSYFNKSVGQLTLPEAATLAGIPQRPSDHSPHRRPDLVVRRRNYVLRRMLEDGHITRAEHDAAVATPLVVVQHRHRSEPGAYFAEEVRQRLEATYGASGLYERGLRVDTTLDLTIQRAAEDAVRDNLLRLDHRRGYRGPLRKLDIADLERQELPSWRDWTGAPGNWAEGIVLRSDGATAEVKIGTRVYKLEPAGIAWTGRRRPSELLKRGDVAWFRLAVPEPGKQGADGSREPYLRLEQEPELQGAAIVLESATGAVRALVGGWAFERTKFNRATQAKRQVGSAFKPFVYGAALEAGFTAADTLFDGPAVFMGHDARLSYSPRNYYRKYYGVITLRRALELSVNVTTVKLMDLVGAERVIDFARRGGIREPLPPYPSLALGSADIIPMQVATAFAAIANQGTQVEPYYVEKVYAQDGTLLESHLPTASKATDPQVAYVLTHMLEGVIDRGTATDLRELDLDLAGKTGTTDDWSDAWFVGFTPRYTLLTWVGYDKKRTIGKNMTGSEAALPAWQKLVERGLEEGWITKGERFAPPPGVVFQSVEYYTGLLPGPGAQRLIEEAFVEGTQPAQTFDARWSGIASLPWFQQRPFYLSRPGERMPDAIGDWSLVQDAWDAKEKED